MGGNPFVIRSQDQVMKNIDGSDMSTIQMNDSLDKAKFEKDSAEVSGYMNTISTLSKDELKAMAESIKYRTQKVSEPEPSIFNKFMEIFK